MRHVLGILLVMVLAAACNPSDPPTPTALPPLSVVELEVIIDPKEAATYLLNPKPFSKGDYPRGRVVSINVLPKEGWKVEKWVGPMFNIDGTAAQVKLESSSTVAVRLTSTSPTPTDTPPPATVTLSPPAIPNHIPTPRPTYTPPRTPTYTPPPTPTPSITAKQRLISIGFNVPRAVPVSEARQEYVASLDIPLEYRERFIEVQNNLNTVLGGYPNYIYIVYDRNGTEQDTQPIFDRLSEVKFSGYQDGYAISELIERARCLASSDSGRKRSPTTNPMSLCIEDLSFIENPWSSDPAVPLEKRYAKMTLHWAHEYFHHYQRAHALDRGVDYQRDRYKPETTVQAPRWWIEGAAVTFQNAWYQANWKSLSFLNDPSARNVSISSVSSSRQYKSVRRSIMGTSSEDTWTGCSPEWHMTTAEETKEYYSDCRANIMATAYLAYKTSYKAVWIDIPQDYYDLGFWGAFEKHVGMTKQEFYYEYNAFLRTGDPEDEPPDGWAPPKGPISAYADFLQIIPESDPVDAKPHY